LLGFPTAYDGDARLRAGLIALAARVWVVPICPEMAGGEDVTAAYLRGAERALTVVQRHGITMAILKQRSPSCGSRFIYDGTHSGSLKPGQGVTAALLRRHGVIVWSA